MPTVKVKCEIMVTLEVSGLNFNGHKTPLHKYTMKDHPAKAAATATHGGKLFVFQSFLLPVERIQAKISANSRSLQVAVTVLA